MKKNSSTKAIDGKKYVWQYRTRDKHDAEKDARALRNDYRLARVLPEMVHGVQYYSVWKGPIRQHRKRREK